MAVLGRIQLTIIEIERQRAEHNTTHLHHHRLNLADDVIGAQQRLVGAGSDVITSVLGHDLLDVVVGAVRTAR